VPEIVTVPTIRSSSIRSYTCERGIWSVVAFVKTLLSMSRPTTTRPIMTHGATFIFGAPGPPPSGRRPGVRSLSGMEPIFAPGHEI
jgi:hypothetical protein